MHKLIARITDSEEREKGFTLIELLVVIIIIGILASIAIPIFLNQKKKAADATVKSDVRNGVSQVESVYTDNPNIVLNPALGKGSSFPLLSGGTTNYSQGDDTGVTVVVSSGNTVDVKPGVDGSYCIDATNPNGSQKDYFYDSTTGQIAKGLCP